MILVGIPVLLAGWRTCRLDGTTTSRISYRAKVPGHWRRAAMSQGDARRGAIVFYQPQLLCATCHVDGKSGCRAGARPDGAGQERSAGAEMVEAILEPSKTIRKGYETVTIVTKAGEDPDRAAARRASGRGGVARGCTGRASRSASRGRTSTSGDDKGPSLMPEGLVNQLGSRQEFLDLVRYLIEIAERGPARALELRPDPAAIGLAPLPEYENDLDHAGIIAGFGRRELRARPEDLRPRLRQLPRHQGPGRLAAVVAPVRIGRVQEWV